MFTGLIEARGRVVAIRRTREGARVRIAASFAGELSRGESVSVDGVCLTVSERSTDGFEADVMARTLSLTTLGSRRRGAEVNLERALKLGDRLGGHMVTGHVDGVAAVVELGAGIGAEGCEVVLELPPLLMRHVAARGSIAIDGVSLTVAAVDGTRVTVSLIPETLEAMVAGRYRPGTRVNVETDVAAKYQESLQRNGTGEEPAGGGITIERLSELGFAGQDTRSNKQ